MDVSSDGGEEDAASVSAQSYSPSLSGLPLHRTQSSLTSFSQITTTAADHFRKHSGAKRTHRLSENKRPCASSVHIAQTNICLAGSAFGQVNYSRTQLPPTPATPTPHFGYITRISLSKFLISVLTLAHQC